MRMRMWPMMMVMVMVHAIVQAHAVLLHRMLLVWLMLLLLLVLRDVRGEATRAAPQCDGDFAVEHLEGNCWD